MNLIPWPRVRDLPEEERAEFTKFLIGQNRPLIEGVPDSEQDAYYSVDYLNWKRPEKDRFFD